LVTENSQSDQRIAGIVTFAEVTNDCAGIREITAKSEPESPSCEIKELFLSATVCERCGLGGEHSRQSDRGHGRTLTRRAVSIQPENQPARR
jgi:hypothetical protein